MNIGRFISVFLAIIFLVLFPMKYKGITEAKRHDYITKYLLDEFIQDTENSGNLTLDRINQLVSSLSYINYSFELKLEIGTIVYMNDQSTLNVEYTEEIMDKLEKNVEHRISLKGKLISISFWSNIESIEAKIANIFWNSYVSDKIIEAGGYIHG